MLKIKLTRTGKRNQPSYRIVVQERRSKRDGKYIDNLGYYYPLSNPKTVKVDRKKYEEWINKGAQPTETVRRIVKKEN